jgi:thiol:disulfide interchange protein
MRWLGLAMAAAVCVWIGASALPARAQFRNVYNPNVDAKADVHNALVRAAREHKRVLLDFGGNWCGDCKVLDIYFHQEPNAALLASHYILVDIDIGQYDRNLDLARRYGIPLQRGVPALAVLSPSGQLLYSQRSGEFEAMSRMDPASVTDFLERWKGKG